MSSENKQISGGDEVSWLTLIELLLHLCFDDKNKK